MDLKNIPNSSEPFDPPEATSVAAPSGAEDDDSSDEEFICNECKEVDWNDLVGKDTFFSFPHESIRLRTIETNHEQLATSSCKICRILSIIKPQSYDNTECTVEAQSLLAFSEVYAVPEVVPEHGIAGLHVYRRDHRTFWYDTGSCKCLAVIRRDSQDSSSRMIPESLVNYDWVKFLAQSCEESHEQCRPRSLGVVPGLKVIAASSRTIIEAPAECRYVALSYVWGKEPDVTQIVASQLRNPSPLIEDTLSATIAMGYEYLWVDKYCISQTDEQEKLHMINQMGRVYENASLTIIKASEGDTSAQSGLPGVSSLTRRPQRYAHFRNTTILELPCGEHELNSCKWATRGWTYQEGYLSRRRLIFTPTQIIFLCRQNYAEECVARLLQQSVTSGRGSMTKFNHLIGRVDLYEDEDYYAGKLMEYSKRHLSHPEDSLNAFLGVLNFEIDERRGTDSPIVHLSYGLVAEERLFVDDSTAVKVDLNWYHETPAQRRFGFPTWSWAGWGGALKFDPAMDCITLHGPGSDLRTLPHLEWDISWSSRANKPVTMWRFVNDYWNTSGNTDTLQLQHRTDYPKRLEVTCFVVPISFEVISLTESEINQKTTVHFEKHRNSVELAHRAFPTESVPVLHFVEGVRIATTAYMDRIIDHQDGIVGLLFYCNPRSANIDFGCILVQRSPGAADGAYERVGAIPRLFYYSTHPLRHESPPLAFLDDTNSILNEVTVSAGQEESLFSCVGGRRTVSLV